MRKELNTQPKSMVIESRELNFNNLKGPVILTDQAKDGRIGDTLGSLVERG